MDPQDVVLTTFFLGLRYRSLELGECLGRPIYSFRART